MGTSVDSPLLLVRAKCMLLSTGASEATLSCTLSRCCGKDAACTTGSQLQCSLTVSCWLSWSSLLRRCTKRSTTCCSGSVLVHSNSSVAADTGNRIFCLLLPGAGAEQPYSSTTWNVSGGPNTLDLNIRQFFGANEPDHHWASTTTSQPLRVRETCTCTIRGQQQHTDGAIQSGTYDSQKSL